MSPYVAGPKVIMEILFSWFIKVHLAYIHIP